jgi:hypothetical protein
LEAVEAREIKWLFCKMAFWVKPRAPNPEASPYRGALSTQSQSDEA